MRQQWKQLKGLTIAYVGDGKGKTTAAVGVATRALGWGWRVCFMQFMKEEKWPSGERAAFKEMMSVAADPHRRHAPVSGKNGVLGAGAPPCPQCYAKRCRRVDVAPTPRGSAHQFPAPALAVSSIDTSATVGGGDAPAALGRSLGMIDIEVVGEGFVGIMGDKKARETHKEAAQKGLARAQEVLTSGKYQLVILDEILSAVDEGLLTEQEIGMLLDVKSADVTLVMTGHRSYPKLFERVDLVTEMKKVKHPFDDGYIAMKGVDY